MTPAPTPEHEVVVAESKHPVRERIDDAVLTGEVVDMVGVAIPEAFEPYDLLLIIDQSGYGSGRHAIARLSTQDARRVAGRLNELAAAVDDARGPRVLPGQEQLPGVA